MLHVIKEVFPNKNESRINTGLMNREYEKSLEDYVVECFQSIELVLNNIKMTSYNFTIDVNEIDMSDYERSRKSLSWKKTGNGKPQSIAFIKKSRVGELTMNFLVELPNEISEKIAEDKKVCKRYANIIDEDYNLRFVVKLLIPMADETGRYLLNGVKFLRLYQLTEASTYITPSTTVLKSIMPVMMKRGKYTVDNLDGSTTYTLNTFRVLMFKSFMNVLYFYFATMGWQQTLEFFRVGDIIELEFFNEDEPSLHPKYEYFRMNERLALKIEKKLLNIKYIQGIVGSILDAAGNNRYTYDQIVDKNTWIKRIGTTKKKVNDEVMLELGNRYLLLFNRMYDITIRDVLRLENHNKKNIYAIIRWMMQNYDALRDKDNLDFMNKRLRGNEQVASLLNDTISTRIKTLISTETDIAEKIIVKFKRFFNYHGRELISRMHSSGLIRSEDSVNDMDMFTKLKFTRKGPNALGNKNSRNVSSSQRAIHPSEIGIDSLCTCSASDPGLTNYVNPLCETDGLFFKDSNPEPESFYLDFLNEVKRLSSEEAISNNSSFVIVDAAKFCNLFDGFDDGNWEEL